MLPKLASLEINPTELEEEARVNNTGSSFLFDFEKGDFLTIDGKLVKVEEKEALKVWIEKTIRIERFRFQVYKGTEHGVLIEDLIGSSYPKAFMESEIEREVTEALTQHPAINSLSNWNFRYENGKTTAIFTVNSIYGQEEMGVDLVGGT